MDGGERGPCAIDEPFRPRKIIKVGDFRRDGAAGRCCPFGDARELLRVPPDEVEASPPLAMQGRDFAATDDVAPRMRTRSIPRGYLI